MAQSVSVSVRNGWGFLMRLLGMAAPGPIPVRHAATSLQRFFPSVELLWASNRCGRGRRYGSVPLDLEQHKIEMWAVRQGPPWKLG